MAATRLIALHVNKGKSVAQCLADRTDYSQNAEKTNNGEFISSYDAMRLFRKFDKHRFVAQFLYSNYTIKLVNNSTATLEYMRKVRTVFCPDFLTQS